MFSGNATAIGAVAPPVSLYVGGLLRKNAYAKNTALLAGEAVADSEILTTVLKDVDHDRLLRLPTAISPILGLSAGAIYLVEMAAFLRATQSPRSL